MCGALYNPEIDVSGKVGLALLMSRMQDWKGFIPGHFGKLLLEDLFLVIRGTTCREYHVFLFEHIILFCKEKGHYPRPIMLKLKGQCWTRLFSSIERVPEPEFVSRILGSVALGSEIEMEDDDEVHYLKLMFEAGGDGEEERSESLIFRCRSREQAKQWVMQFARMIETHRGSARRGY